LLIFSTQLLVKLLYSVSGCANGLFLVHGGKSTVPPTNQSKTDYSASPTHTEIQHKFALSQFSAHISVFHTDNRIRHRQYRSANNLTNTNNTNSETSTTSYTQGYSNYTSNNVIITKAPFILYVPGFYGEDCLNRAFAYMAANPGVYTYADAACACIGNCRPPLAPNPDAYNWYRNNVVSSSNVIRLVISNAPYIAATSIIMIAGLGGMKSDGQIIVLVIDCDEFKCKQRFQLLVTW
jgi:hypothetical protein